MATKEELSKLDAEYEKGRQESKNDGIVAHLVHEVIDTAFGGNENSSNSAVKAREEGYQGHKPSHHK